MLRPFAHPVACCCLLLGVVAQNLKPVQTEAKNSNTVASVCTELNDFHPLLNVQLQSLGIKRMKLKGNSAPAGNLTILKCNELLSLTSASPW